MPQRFTVLSGYSAPYVGLNRSARNSVCGVRIPRDRGSVLVRRRCDTLSTYGFTDDVTFGRNGRKAGKDWQHSESSIIYKFATGVESDVYECVFYSVIMRCNRARKFCTLYIYYFVSESTTNDRQKRQSLSGGAIRNWRRIRVCRLRYCYEILRCSWHYCYWSTVCYWLHKSCPYGCY